VSQRSIGLLLNLVILIIVAFIAYTVISWAIFDPSLTPDQRLIAAGAGVVIVAILLGVTVTCFFKGARVRIG